MVDIVQYVTDNNVSLHATYSTAIQMYDKDIIDFLMYDIYRYDRSTMNTLNDIDDLNNLNNLNNLDDQLSEHKYRVGQEDFRDGLIRRYGRCMITGDEPSVCEACHIIPHKEGTNYKIDNGLFLSASIHKLFDTKQLTIDGTTHKVVLLNPLKHANYKKYDGMYIKELTEQTAEYLTIHNSFYRLS